MPVTVLLLQHSHSEDDAIMVEGGWEEWARLALMINNPPANMRMNGINQTVKAWSGEGCGGLMRCNQTRVLKEQLLMGLRWMSPAVDESVVEMSLPGRRRIRSDTSVRLHVTPHSAQGPLLWQHNKKSPALPLRPENTFTSAVCECSTEYVFELFIWTVLNPAWWKTF